MTYTMAYSSGMFKRDFPRECHGVEYFKKLLRYDPKTGKLYWKKRMSSVVRPGDEAGSRSDRGYLNVAVDRKMYKAHRIAWLLSHGKWPDFEIDHITGDRLDNRISNLRDVMPKVNQSNRSCHREGVLWGTTKIQNGKYFQARVHGKYLGNFKTMEEAHLAAISYSKEV